MSIGSLVLALLSAAGAGFLWRRRADDPPTDWPSRPAGAIAPIRSDPAGPASPRFSVIVPTYNRGRVLVEALEREADFLARYPDVGVVFSDLEKHDGARFAPSFMRTTEVFSPRLRRGGPTEMILSAREMYLYLLQEAVVKTPALTARRPLL